MPYKVCRARNNLIGFHTGTADSISALATSAVARTRSRCLLRVSAWACSKLVALEVADHSRAWLFHYHHGNRKIHADPLQFLNVHLGMRRHKCRLLAFRWRNKAHDCCWKNIAHCSRVRRRKGFWSFWLWKDWAQLIPYAVLRQRCYCGSVCPRRRLNLRSYGSDNVEGGNHLRAQRFLYIGAHSQPFTEIANRRAIRFCTPLHFPHFCIARITSVASTEISFHQFFVNISLQIIIHQYLLR